MMKRYLSNNKNYLAINFLFIALLITFKVYAHQLYHQIEGVKKRLSLLTLQAKRFQETTTLLKARHEDFMAFEACRFEYPITASILQNSSSYPIEFGPVLHLSASHLGEMSKSIDLESTEVTFSISCLNDKDIFTLIDQLTHQGPGIFQIQEVTINRIGPLTEEMVKKIAAGKPQILFDGKIMATWIHRCLVFILSLVYSNAYTTDLCLMLSPAEETAIRLAQNQALQGSQAKNPNHLRLDGIIYSHQTSWTIWLNGRPIKAGQVVDDVRVLKVTPEFVEIIWNPKPTQRHQILLKPNHVFQNPSTLLQGNPISLRLPQNKTAK